jgi:sulfonate transport system substrate-binding protein
MQKLFRHSRLLEAAAALAVVAALLLIAGTAHAAPDKTVRIGFQKYGTLVLLKVRGTLEKRLAPLGYNVAWTEFPGGPQLLEALNVGALDFGTTGEAPPVFAQAAGAPLLYVGFEPPAPRGEAILVAKDSPVRTVADLKGKKVALNKGSNVHYLLVRALEEAGLSITDITPQYLAPADARAAFQAGSVDAWVIWDPFQAAAEAATGARTLRNGVGIVANHQFLLAAKPFAGASPKIVQEILAELDSVEQWAAGNQEEVAKLLSPSTGIPVPVLQTALERLTYGVKPIDDQVVQQQQKIADTFFNLKLIPKQISIREAVWTAPK